MDKHESKRIRKYQNKYRIFDLVQYLTSMIFRIAIISFKIHRS